ncbi:MAG: hypothetical protein Q7U53_08600 [Anaerolineaceae bacterium]|nr:hypothetical protein [Anaerolineaceae bacterium]
MKKKKKTPYIFIILITILLFISVACQLPLDNASEKSPDTDLEATIVALQTQIVQPTINNQNPTQVETNTPTETTQLPFEPDQSFISQYQGFVAFQNGLFSAYDFDGISLGMELPAGTSTWYGDNEINVFSDEIFYAEFSENSGVFRVNAQGTMNLDFIDSQDPVSIAVSQDKQLIAWSTSHWGESDLRTDIYYANLDGSNTQLIDNIPENVQADLQLIFYPVKWTDDGRLIYATGMTGIGGYMIFWGYNGLFIYNPLNNSIRTLVDDQERLGICLSSISDDLTKIAIVCGSDNTVRVRTLSTGIETAFPVMEDQVLAGSARFSPSGEWLAYVIQRADPMQELGKVVVVPVDGSQPPRIVATVEDGSFVAEGWVSEEYIIVTQSSMSSNQTVVLKISRDGGEVTQIANGKFMDFIP